MYVFCQSCKKVFITVDLWYSWGQVASVLHCSPSTLFWLFWVFLTLESVCQYPRSKMLGLWLGLFLIDILTILIHPLHKHRMSLHLFISFISFLRVLWFSSYQCYPCFVRFVPKYLIFRGANVNSIVLFQILFLHCCYMEKLWTFVY